MTHHHARALQSPQIGPEHGQDPDEPLSCNDNRQSSQRQRVKYIAIKVASYIPEYVLRNYVLTDAEKIVLAFHIRFSDFNGTHDKPINYIASVTKLSRRTIQNASLRLGAGRRTGKRPVEGLGLIHVEKRRLTPHDNDTNVYRLSSRLLDAVFSNKGGAKVRTVRGLSPTLTNNTLTRAQNTSDGKVKKERKQVAQAFNSFASEPSPKESEVEPSQHKPKQHTMAMDAYLVRKARLCLLVLGEDPESVRSIKTAKEACTRIDELRQVKATSLYPAIWNRALRRHGIQAYFAVLETLILDKFGHVRSTRGQYLAGILKKHPRGTTGDPRQECRPEETIDPFLLQRFGPALVKPSNLEFPNLEQIAAARISEDELDDSSPPSTAAVGAAIGSQAHEQRKAQWGY